ncbi:hypothetical protein BU17DRAFT_81573 [Hysterangium stoloniferum]|nr:hypothetical protein BU17DRAFT_81573 [Hysterangium stoloniferum]
MDLSQSPETKQREEIEVLRSIFPEKDFLPPPPKNNAWNIKGPPEFILRVRHPESECADAIRFDLHVAFTQRYPSSLPILKIQRPVFGLTEKHVNILQELINGKARKGIGNPMIYDIYDLCLDWLRNNIKAEIPAPSLASEMTHRAAQEEEALQMHLEAEADLRRQEEERQREQFTTQLNLDSLRKKETQRVERQKARKRGLSTSDEPIQTAEVPIEVFKEKIHVFCSNVKDEIEFDSVMIFNPRPGHLGTIWQAVPLCEAPRGSLVLDLHLFNFNNNYYETAKGRKKLEEIESVLRVQSAICHPHLSTVYAVKLSLGQNPRMAILVEQEARILLDELLNTATSLSLLKATDFLRQSLSALKELHQRELMHMNIETTCVGVFNTPNNAVTSTIKLQRASWFVMLSNLHKSNPFGPFPEQPKTLLPETWLPKEAVHSPLSYTRTRDISQLAVVFIQMVLGTDAALEFNDPPAAIRSTKFPETMRDMVMAMWEASRRRTTSCLTLLNNLPTAIKSERRPSLTITSPSVLKLHGKFWSGRLPEVESNSFSTQQSHSRWREDWEELEHLGEGGFGRVVKARNRLDGRIYAVKKIKLLQNTRDDEKIFREVKLLSRLQHRHIVRYYTTWLESPDGAASGSSSDFEDDSSSDGSEETSRQPNIDDPFAVDLDELVTHSGRNQATSFPSIHFSQGSSGHLSSMDDSDSEESGSLSPVLSRYTEKQSMPPSHRILYIQMEFVERQTLIERIAEGLSEDDAWRLFHQLLDALAHMCSLGILHRDIKCGNIFIDKNGDVKVGDFGLATSNFAAAVPSSSFDTDPAKSPEDMTLDIGTRLYTAPEVISSGSVRKHDHTKADMYSLGIVFFEMNFSFSTQSERIAVLENLRTPEIVFPTTWQGRLRQRQSEGFVIIVLRKLDLIAVITSLLQHDVDARPTAQQLSRSDLLPPKVQDEYFRDALSVMTQRGSVHYGEVLNSLFGQAPRPTALAYDRDLLVPAYAPLLPIVQDHLSEIFRLHGAVDSSLPSLLPKVQSDDYGPNTVFFLDRDGELVSLPRNGLLPMARRAAQNNIRRIKRYHIGDVFSTSLGGGHPNVRKAAVVDIITPDLTLSAAPAVAELLGIADQCLNAFPGPELQDYVIQVTHTDIKTQIYNRIPAARRTHVQDVLSQGKTSWRTKRGLLVKANIAKGTLDELEVLSESDDLELLMANVSKVSTSLQSMLAPMVDEIRQVTRYAKAMGVSRAIKFRPLMDNKNFIESGVWFQIVRPSKRVELIAAGGRYDHLIRKFADPTMQLDAVRAFAVQIDIERIAMHLATHQSTSVSSLIKEKRSFGAFSPRRCDVYVFSFQAGHMIERLEIAAFLWKHNISADIMYDIALNNGEDHVKRCADEGILFIVYPKPPTARQDQPAFKVKSVLRETETGVTRHDLVPFLLSQIADQRKIDIAASSITNVSSQTLSKEPTVGDDVQLILLQDANRKLKKPPKGIKDALNPAKEKASDLAYAFGSSLRQSIQQGLPIVAVDIPASAFNVMISDANAGWLTNEDAWRAVLSAMPQIPSARAAAIKEAVMKKKEEGKRHVLLFHLHDERAFLFNFQ